MDANRATEMLFLSSDEETEAPSAPPPPPLPRAFPQGLHPAGSAATQLLRRKTEQDSTSPCRPSQAPPSLPQLEPGPHSGTDRVPTAAPSSSSQVEEPMEVPRGLTESLRDAPCLETSAVSRKGRDSNPYPASAHCYCEDLGQTVLVPRPSSLRSFSRGHDTQFSGLLREFQIITSAGCIGEGGLGDPRVLPTLNLLIPRRHKRVP